MYTVRQLANLAGVSVRTLHYYDEIGLLHPARVGTNGYRYYDDAALLRLQQILFYREMGLELNQIKDVLESPDFDLRTALRAHRGALEEKIIRLERLVDTVNTTIMYLSEDEDMNQKKLFEGFSEEKQKYYEREARLQWGPDNVNESIRRWNSYGAERQQAILDEGGQIYTEIAKALEAGTAPQSAEVRALLERWHEHLRHFYEPTLEILRGLGELYSTNPEFMAFFQQLHPQLPDYLAEAVAQYVDDLETAEIERMLAADASDRISR